MPMTILTLGNAGIPFGVELQTVGLHLGTLRGAFEEAKGPRVFLDISLQDRGGQNGHWHLICRSIGRFDANDHFDP